jgi:hypothetical protein
VPESDEVSDPEAVSVVPVEVPASVVPVVSPVADVVSVCPEVVEVDVEVSVEVEVVVVSPVAAVSVVPDSVVTTVSPVPVSRAASSWPEVEVNGSVVVVDVGSVYWLCTCSIIGEEVPAVGAEGRLKTTGLACISSGPRAPAPMPVGP